VDANNNCVRDAGENGVQNVQIHASGLGYAFTNTLGVYSFMAPTGTYTITESVQQMYPLASCQSNNQVVSVTAATNCATTVDFANNVIVLHDLHIITTNMTPPIPGNVYTQKVIVQNDGSAVESTIQLGYEHDGQLAFNSCTPWALTQPNAGTYPNWYRFTSGFPTLNPGASSASFIDYNVPTNIPLNTVVNFYDTVAYNAPMASTWLTDNTPWNNVNNHQALVIGSYDPNFKEVTPKGTGPQGDILGKDSILTYVVHFQNTGSYYAQNIVVTDTLDPDLNLASVRPGYSDHAYTISMSETGVMKFAFKNINLPWKASYGDALSSGMFSYSVKLKSNSAIGTQVQNKAAIYFDYNEPVITNTTFNTIVAAPVVMSLNGLSIDPNHAALFPNPASNYFTLLVTGVENAGAVLTVTDISGRAVSTKNITLHTGENSITENTASLQSGIYFVQLKSANITIGKKLVIAK
jgi:type IX secretion system substrate protein